MTMVGCFGECALGDDEKTESSSGRFTVVFHPPIQTRFREKEPTKWYTDMVNSLATLGEDPNQLNQFGEAPLCMAAYRAQGLIVEELLQRENINVNIKGKHGRTPLYLAAEEGHVYIVKLLLLHPDIDVNCRNAPRGATALMAASRRGHSRVVELLLQHPAVIPDMTDRDGYCALNHARTSSVKWKLHNHSTRSRSLENVLPSPNRSAGNLCHVTDISSSSSSSLDSVGETKKRVPGRQLSSTDLLGGIQLAAGTGAVTRRRRKQRPVISQGEEEEEEQHVSQGEEHFTADSRTSLVSGSSTEPESGSPPQGGSHSRLGACGLAVRARAHSESNTVQEKLSSTKKFFRNFDPPAVMRSGWSGSRGSLHQSSPSESGSPARSPLSALARARNIFLFGESSPTERSNDQREADKEGSVKK